MPEIKRNPSDHAKRDFSAYDCDRHLEDIYKLAVLFVNVYVDPDFKQFGCCIMGKYLSAERIGRSKQNLRRQDRGVVFDVFEEYIRLRTADGYDCDWDDMAYRLTQLLKEHPQPCNYSEIIIDEAQDFSPMMLRSMTTFAGQKCRLMWIGDMGQCIFNNSRLPWKDVGMIVRKSITLKSNYRNTKEIAAFADEMRLLMDLNDDDGCRTNKCVQEGKLPDVRIATSEEQGKNWVTETVKRWKRSGSSVGIILPTKAMVAEYKNMLSEYDPVVINRELKSFTTKEGLFISHYHAIKGFEFDRIIMPACVSDSFISTAGWRDVRRT